MEVKYILGSCFWKYSNTLLNLKKIGFRISLPLPALLELPLPALSSPASRTPPAPYSPGLPLPCSPHPLPLVAGTSGAGLSPGRGHCVVFLDKTLTVRLLKPGLPRQWKPIRWHNWNNRFQHFQIQHIKCPISNPANQMSGTKLWNLNLFVLILTRLWYRLSINCQAQTVSTFACLLVEEELNYMQHFLWGSWLV